MHVKFCKKVKGSEVRLLAELLDARYRLIKTKLIRAGAVNESLIHPRGIIKPAITIGPTRSSSRTRIPRVTRREIEADRQATGRNRDAVSGG